MIDLFSPGAYARAAGGNQEIPQFQKQAVDWIAWSINPDNGGGGGIAVWEKARQKWDAAGILNFPWLHCRNFADINRLIDVGLSQNSPAIGLNIEDVVADFPGQLAQVASVVQGRWSKPVHMASLCWLQNGQGWQHMSFAVGALEMFYDEVPACRDVSGCVKHAFDEGLSKITLMYKTKLAPSEYDLSICHSLYTSDDIPPTQAGWAAWTPVTPCTRLVKETKVPLTVKQFPYTGPFYEGDRNHPTIKGVKRGMIRLKYLDQTLGSETDDFGPDLREALRVFQREVGIVPASGNYGRGTWNALRYEKVLAGPNRGQYAMDALALRYVREDALTFCYPHPLTSTSSVCQGLHATDGLVGNWAIDFCAPGGTKVLAVERAKITKLSGRDPALGADQAIGIFGWSIHYETPEGYRYFTTHYGTRSPLSIGQIVDVGDVLGTVGAWPGDPGRSHTHIGVTSPLGVADARQRITTIANAPRVTA